MAWAGESGVLVCCVVLYTFQSGALYSIKKNDIGIEALRVGIV